MTAEDTQTGVELIAAERATHPARGYDAEHDEGQGDRLMAAAECYLMVAMTGAGGWQDGDGRYVPPGGWPWNDKFWRPSEDPARNLVKAGALIAAALDSLIVKPTTLDGATTPGEMNAWPSNPGEFAARWNAATEEERADRLTGMIDASERSLACFLGGHLDHIAALEAKIASAKAVTAEEPMIVSAMRRQPTGEVRYLSDPKERGMLGTSTRGFLHELDEWAAHIKREAAAEALEATAEEVSCMYAGTDGTDRERAWIGGVDASARKIRDRAAEIREGKS